jgi:hypothetical protein
MARAESIELGNCIMELAAVGQEKGTKCNFESILNGALRVVERHKTKIQNTDIKEIEDSTEYLRKKHQNTGKKQDIIGMV